MEGEPAIEVIRNVNTIREQKAGWRRKSVVCLCSYDGVCTAIPHVGDHQNEEHGTEPLETDRRENKLRKQLAGVARGYICLGLGDAINFLN